MPPATRPRTAGQASSTPASTSSATPSGAAWPGGEEATSPASPQPSAPRRRKRKASRSGPGTSTGAAARTCPASLRKSTPRYEAGSTITEPSTAPSCASSHGASTSTSPGGPCTSSNGSAAGTPKRWPGCKRSTSTSPAYSPTGGLSPSPPTGLWGPDDGRPSRPVCAVRRFVVSPTQLGGTRRNVPGSPGLPGWETGRGQEHAREAVAVWRRPGRGAARPARYGQGWIA